MNTIRQIEEDIFKFRLSLFNLRECSNQSVPFTIKIFDTKLAWAWRFKYHINLHKKKPLCIFFLVSECKVHVYLTRIFLLRFYLQL